MDTKSPPTTIKHLRISLPVGALKYCKSLLFLAPIIALIISLLPIRVAQYAGSLLHISTARGNNSVGLDSYECVHSYSVEMLSVDPVVIYLNHFISDFEIDYLIDTYSSGYRLSEVFGSDLVNQYDPVHRMSKSAPIPREDAVSRCLMSRMKSLLGNLQHQEVEALQLLRYDVDGQFRLHYDWFPFSVTRKNATGHDREMQRLGTIFVYLNEDCVGGETYFPDIRGVSANADGEKFSRTDTGEGLLVKPKKGNAVFWNNMHMNGTGDSRVLHAGLPIKSGVKLGMNMFSTYFTDSPLFG